MKKCFIVCPIGQEGSETRNRSDKLLKFIIAPVCKECDYEPIRIDIVNTNGVITEEIIDHLKNDELVIADISELNPNAFYEIGYRSALGRHIIHLRSKSQNIPFDISTIRTFDYELTDLESVDQLKSRLTQTISALSDDTPNSEDMPENNISNNFNSQIFQELYKIQDMLKDIHNNMKTNDTGAVSVLADKLVSTNKSSEAAINELLLTKFIENPSQILSLVDFVNKLPEMPK
ncbi:nucleoside 2-deoxyribosyltransferase [Anaerocolumna sp. AGMB13020]|uniref:nucleoside 2-deoxyribosyltransferase n=1 Tax=Anaerocolumna sp. AGMB13020 TaxID=3081750 RepID=UPI002952F26B|nr:nucleoside 2-deoxyribosyltransferase [Anaerocolumna sp. AGMB13020]WOO36056.1 nucleoside 2-deoxyribosyltransferase [Anaerocolumna sp. AGMB13020]